MSEAQNKFTGGYTPWIKPLCSSTRACIVADPAAIANRELNITIFSNRNCCRLQQHDTDTLQPEWEKAKLLNVRQCALNNSRKTNINYTL